MKLTRIVLSIVLLCILQGVACAQSTLPADKPLRVFLVTFGPGADPWEKFGHDCIVIEDENAQTSLAYNWGMFDFGTTFKDNLAFAVHFLHGRLLYFMGSDPTAPLIDIYIQAGRSALVQELQIAPEQKLALQARLIASDTPANRFYLYDYFKKNCATMCRDQIDQSVGGKVADAFKEIPTGTTYRWHDRRTTADSLWLYLFLDFALGHPVDLPLSAWQESFLPGKLALHLRSVKVRDQTGNLVPLVKWEKQLSPGTFPERDVPPTSYFYYFLASGIAAGGITGGLALVGRKFRLARWIFVLLTMAWSLLMGLLGALTTYAWFSDHLAAKWNENWLQGNPLSLLLVILAPMAFRWPRAAKRIGCAVLGLSIFGLLAKLTPWFWQSNGSIIAIALPIHAGVGWGIVTFASRTSPSPDLSIRAVPHADAAGPCLLGKR